MKNILITGCAGFIGSTIANRLIHKGFKVYGIDDLSTGKLKNLPKKLIFIKGKCEQEKVLKKIKNKNIKVILHFAGQSSGEKSFYDPVNDFNRNLLSTVKLLDFYTKNKCEHFIYASSMSVYGDSDRPVSEKSFCNPKAFYGVSKLSSENYIKMYKNKNINYTILRFFNVYGPGQTLDNLRQGIIRIYLSQIYKSKKLLVKGSKYRFRDFIYIDDVIDILLKIIGNKKCYGETFNVGSGKKYYISEVIKMLKKKTKIKFPIKYTKGTPLDQTGICSNNNKIKKFLKINLKYNLNSGLQKFINSINKSSNL